MKTIKLISDYIADIIIEATGGTSQSDNTEELPNVDPDNKLQTKSETEKTNEDVTLESDENKEDSGEVIQQEVNENVEQESQEN
jgi:hypothetical protein